jgi:outer membrane biosynthesis protein TonB
MSWLLRDNWLGSVLAFVVGAGITWVLLDRRRPAPAIPTPQPSPAPPAAKRPTPPPASTPRAPAPPTPVAQTPAAEPPKPTTPTEPDPAPASSATPAPAEAVVEQPVFSQLMGGEATLFDHIQPAADTAPDAPTDVPAGRYGEGSADAVPHQGPPDGFTIKGNAQSMLFHTPDSPYYGRTKPEVWFRTEADAERAGFTKYTRRPRKAADPRD